MRSLTDYIIFFDCQIFQNVAVQDPRQDSAPLHGHGVSGFLPPRVISHITYVTGYASLFFYPNVRRGHRQTIFLRSLGALSQSKTNWRGITTRGFPSRRGDSCMIVYMSPLRSNSTFFLYSPTILLEKNCRVINYCFYQVNQK